MDQDNIALPDEEPEMIIDNFESKRGDFLDSGDSAPDFDQSNVDSDFVIHDQTECKLCYRSFKYPSKLKYHLKKHKKEDLDAICLLEEKDLKWNCSECSHKFLTESLLENHAKYVHRSPMKSHKCDECGEKFESYSILRLHSRRVHKIILKPIECDFCHKLFEYPSKLKRHQMIWHGPLEDKDEHTCQFCHKTYDNLYKLKNHIKKVHERKEMEKFENINTKEDLLFKCETCNLRFLTTSSKNFHVKTKHNGESLKCKLCMVKFRTHARLEKHFSKVHRKERTLLNSPENDIKRPFSCDRCNDFFPSEQSVLYHKLRVHKSNEMHCELCNVTFKTSYGLRCHKMYVHVNELEAFDKKYENFEIKNECSICEKKFVTVTSLKAHMKRRHQSVKKSGRSNSNSDTICKLCKISFKSTNGLTLHMDKIHKEDTQMFDLHPSDLLFNMKCRFCENVYPSDESLQYHIRTSHPSSSLASNPAKEFFVAGETLCKLCRVTFKSENGLAFHKSKFHSNEVELFSKDKGTLPLSHECTYCSKKYPSEGSLKYHMRRHSGAVKRFLDAESKAFCKLCRVKFCNTKGFMYHKNKIHITELDKFNLDVTELTFSLQCKFCEMKCSTPSSLKYHTDMKHYSQSTR